MAMFMLIVVLTMLLVALASGSAPQAPSVVVMPATQTASSNRAVTIFLLFLFMTTSLAYALSHLQEVGG